jgi:hypothetical protein
MTTDPTGLPGSLLDQPMVCPVLVGRGPHLEAILHCVAEARTRQAAHSLRHGQGVCDSD